MCCYGPGKGLNHTSCIYSALLLSGTARRQKKVTMAAAGYNYEFVDEVPGNCKCPICKKVFRDPQRVSCCEEEYCRACIEQSLRDNRRCPNQRCGNNDEYIVLSEAMRTRRQVDQLRCYCSNRREGCEWEGELQELNNHLNENPTNENQLNGCDFTTVHCRWCQEIFPRNEIGEHQENVCQLRLFTCQHCDHQDTYQRVMAIHLPKCPRQPVECPQGCGLSPRRQSLAAHKAEECPKTMIKCEVPGCEEKRKREHMPAHIQEFSIQHMQLLSQKVRELENEIRQRREQQNARHLPITLTVTNFEQHQAAGDIWASKLFYTHNEGYALYLTVYAGGRGIGSILEYMSVYVHVARGEYDDQLEWPCQVSIKLELLSQQENGENERRVIDIQAERTAKKQSKGWLMFMRQDSVQEQFVKDNCLKFRVSIANNEDNA